VATPEDNKELILRFYREIDAGNIDAMDELVAEDYINHDPPPFPGLATGREGLKQMFKMFWGGTPGRHEIEDQIAQGDKVVTVLRGIGKHTGELAGIPPSGNELNVKAVAVHRIDGEMIVEHWSAVDSAALLSQLGLIQLPPRP
jgi:steroid delta-isomerase-like uncharacterized protein